MSFAVLLDSLHQELRGNFFLLTKRRFGASLPVLRVYFCFVFPLGVQSRIVDDGVVLPYGLIGGETLTAMQSSPPFPRPHRTCTVRTTAYMRLPSPRRLRGLNAMPGACTYNIRRATQHGSQKASDGQMPSWQQ